MAEKLKFTEKENGYEASTQDTGQVIYWLRFYPERELLIHKWIGFQFDEGWISVWKYTLDFCEKRDILRFKSIADTSALEGSFDGINDFIMQEVLPRVIASGFKYSAYVLPQEFYAMLATQFYQEEAKEMPFITRYFDNLAEAEKWLMSIDN